MNSKDNLQRALKKAFEDHKEPLHEAQWDRLSAVLDKEKPSKKRFLPWFFITFGTLLLAVAIGIFVMQKSPTTAAHSNKDNTIAAQSQVAKEDTFSVNTNKTNSSTNQDQITNNPTSANQTTATTNSASSDQTNPSQLADATTPAPAVKDGEPKGNGPNSANKGKPKNLKNDPIDNNNKKRGLTNGEASLTGGKNNKGRKGNKPFKQATGETTTASSTGAGNNGNGSKPALVDAQTNGQENPTNAPSTKGEGNATGASSLKPMDNTVPKQDTTPVKVDPGKLADTTSDQKDSTKPDGDKKNNNNNDDEPPAKPKFAIGFSSGIGTTRFMVNTITNASKIHKDAGQLFQQTNENSKANHFNFNFEWYPIQKFAIGFAAGLQYRSIVQTFDFSYKLNQVALRDTNENITGYFFVPDTSDPLIFKLQGRNQLNYVNVPIRVMYTLPINNKNELLFSAGISTSFVTKANGKAFSINTTQLSSLSDLYKNKVNVGWSLGLQYSYNVYKKWWLGSEFQYQQNKYNYSLDYGVLRSRIKITNYNLAVRYKF